MTLKVNKALNELDDLMEQKEGIKELKGRIFDIQLVTSQSLKKHQGTKIQKLVREERRRINKKKQE